MFMLIVAWVGIWGLAGYFTVKAICNRIAYKRTCANMINYYNNQTKYLNNYKGIINGIEI